AGGSVGALAHGDAARAAGGLKTSGDVDRVADHRVVAADGAGQHLAGVHADAQGEAHAVRLVEGGVDVRHRILHSKRGAHRALGVVLVRHRRAEDRHHVVADVLVDGAAVALHLVAEATQAALYEALDRLGVHLLRHGRVARQVGEYDGHAPALLREGLGGLYLRADRLVERRAARHAEASLGRQWRVADGAAALECAATGHAEASAFRVLVRAARARSCHFARDDIPGCSASA